MKKVLTRLIKVVAFFVVIFAVWKISSRDTTNSLQVREVELENRVVEKTVSANGEVKSEKDTELGFKTVGKIYSIPVVKGQEVKKGDLLVQLENYSQAQNAQAYKDLRDISQRDIDLFIENYADNLSAYGGKDEYDIRLRKYYEELSNAEADYQAVLSSLWDTYIYAPFDGVITDIFVEESEAITATIPVIRISDLNNLIFEIELDQEDYGFVQEGQKVEIELDAYDDKKVQGYVLKLPYYANGGGANTFEVEIKITSEEIKPLMGMTGDAHIVVASTNESVPSLMFDEVFYDEEDKPYVWILNGEIIEKHNIETGLEGDIYTEIISSIDKPILVGLNDNVEMKEGYKAKFVDK